MIANQIAGLMGVSAPVSLTDYESIATANGTGSSGTITFSSIPSTYKHLQIRLMAKDTGGVSPEIQVTFNSDTAANYSRHRLTGNGTSAASFGQANTSNIPFIGQVGLPTAASTYGVAVIDVLEYANTNIYKTLRVLSGQDSNGGGGLDFTSGSWRNTAAISTVTVSLSGSNYTTASQIALYGIK
jgi:hypothetical protein